MNYSNRTKLNVFKALISCIMVIISLIWIGTSWVSNSLGTYNYFQLKGLDEDFAIYGLVCFIIAISLFCLRFFIKYLMIGLLSEYKKVFIGLSKVLQVIHVPFALLGVSFIAAHVYVALLMGFRLSATYIMGVIALIDMVLLLITSVRRIFNKAIKGHKVLGILFIILFIIHLLIFKLFGIN